MSPVTIAIAILALLLAAFATYRRPRLMAVTLWATLTTIFVAAALVIVLPGPFALKAFWSALLLPVLWTAIQFWIYWADHPRHVIAGLSVALVSSILVVVFVQPDLGI